MSDDITDCYYNPEKDEKELQVVKQEIENKMREKYNPDDIFKGKNEIQEVIKRMKKQE